MVLQASIAGPRDDYANCLHKIQSQAEAQKVAPDQYSAFAKQQCSSQGATFKAALVAFDTKNGVKRDRASSDADMQLDDYVASSQEKYAAKVKFDAPRAAPAPAPAPVVAAAAPAPKKD
ncbi:hypothetical protein [Sphingomonas alba]|uniref:Uncharacterized protein n=1 Tax=Sphingomonas alba TaxID=2908208 RepID=A0ABT0RK10_9SPHN|nr:hypothetical protein [Sphingomonas alba]MCL6682973.1 hypothetical protein [Sphingomonas alba]